jgi:CRISPR/Cas system-associated exonuclease Cas4 (RecB family)
MVINLLRRLDRYAIEPDYLQISYLDAFCYCPRLFWYAYVFKLRRISEIPGNHKGIPDSVLGTIFRESEIKVFKHVRVFSSRLRIVGYTDLVEDESGRLQVVEYLEDENAFQKSHILLCAKALCLEDTVGKDQVTPYGDVFFGIQDYHRIQFTTEIKSETEAVILDAFTLLSKNSPPSYSQNKARCQNCSLYHICFM